MLFHEITAVIVTVFLVASCAGTDIGSAGALSPEQKKSLHLAAVTAEAAHDVMMNRDALDRIVQRVKADIMADTPNVFASASTENGPALTMKVIFTDYDKGDHASRFERRNVGTTRIDADVLFVDPSGRTVARSQVATHFGSGGDVGLTTDIRNVEDDFEMAVARLVR
jgi:hypothetical protein